MAGDWIKMRSDLSDDPAVITMANSLAIPRLHVVGCLHCVWSWFDAQSRSGHAPRVTPAFLNERVGVTGFAEAMRDVDWLDITETGLQVPKFEDHCSQSAKDRALTTRRKRASRSRSCHGASVTKTGPEQSSREEKRREESSSAAGSSPGNETAALLPSAGSDVIGRLLKFGYDPKTAKQLAAQHSEDAIAAAMERFLAYSEGCRVHNPLGLFRSLLKAAKGERL